MKRFKYSARTKEGAIDKGVMEAKNPQAVSETLQGKGLIVVSVKEDLGLSLSRLEEINIGGVPMKDKVLFMRQLSTMISAGLPLTQALEILYQQANNPLFKRVLSDVLGDVQGGKSLSASFKSNADVFDEITINLIAAGEDSGNLETVLQRLAVELEESKKLQDKVKSAMIYPAIICVVIVVVIILLMVVLVPAMSDIYSEFDAELPLVTRMLIGMSEGFLKFWWAIAIFTLSIILGVRFYYQSPDGKKFFHRMMLKLPIFGPLFVKMQLAQFTRILALLLKSGLSIVEALKLTANSMSNVLFKNAVLEAKKEVEKGTQLTIPLSRSELFPLIVSQMVSVGEESGEMDLVLDKMAEYYNDEVQVMTSNLSTMLEPLILIVMGVVIGFIALAVYMPMFSLTEVLG